jgi:hypothetical protein
MGLMPQHLNQLKDKTKGKSYGGKRNQTKSNFLFAFYFPFFLSSEQNPHFHPLTLHTAKENDITL